MDQDNIVCCTCSVDEGCEDEEYNCALNNNCSKVNTVCNVGSATPTSGGSSLVLFSRLSTIAVCMIVAIGLHF